MLCEKFLERFVAFCVVGATAFNLYGDKGLALFEDVIALLFLSLRQ